MSIPITATGVYQLIITDKQSNSVKNTITVKGIDHWVTNGIPETLRLSALNINTSLTRDMNTVPDGVKFGAVANLKQTGIVNEDDDKIVFRYVYESRNISVPNKQRLNALIATIEGTPDTLFSVANIKNLDNENIVIDVESNETISIVYELRISVNKQLLNLSNIDIGYLGLIDYTVTAIVGDDPKANFKDFKVNLYSLENVLEDHDPMVSGDALKQVKQTNNGNGKSLLAEYQLLFNEHEPLKTIKMIEFEFKPVKFRILLNPTINRVTSSVDLNLSLPIEIRG